MDKLVVRVTTNLQHQDLNLSLFIHERGLIIHIDSLR